MVAADREVEPLQRQLADSSARPVRDGLRRALERTMTWKTNEVAFVKINPRFRGTDSATVVDVLRSVLGDTHYKVTLGDLEAAVTSGARCFAVQISLDDEPCLSIEVIP